MIDKILITLYFIATIALGFYLYRLGLGVVNNEFFLRGYHIFFIFFALFIFVMGLLSFFRRGLLPFIYYHSSRASSAHSFEQFIRRNKAAWLLMAIAVLLFISGDIFDRLWYIRLGFIIQAILGTWLICEAIRNSKFW